MFSRMTSLAARAKERRDYRSFLAAGNPPWQPGYHAHKTAAIARAIADPAYDPFHLPPRHGWRLDERVVEYPWLIARLPSGAGTLLDAGSTLNQPTVLGHPKLREKRCFISTLAPESWAAWQWGVSYVFEDLRNSCFRDGFFDWVACISTLEHVGLDNTMLYTGDASKRENDTAAFAGCLAELRRVLKPGGTLFLTVPFGTYENHGWFQVFDAPLLDRAVAAFGPTRVTETIYRYLPEGWTVGSRESAADATYFDIHKRKGYDPDYAAASRAVACLELVR